MAANAEITVTLKGDTAEVDAIVRNAMALLEENKTLRETLQGIANADWRKWDEEMRSPGEFVKWAKSRAQHTLVAIGAYRDEVTPNAKVTGSPALSASPSGLPGYATEVEK